MFDTVEQSEFVYLKNLFFIFISQSLLFCPRAIDQKGTNSGILHGRREDKWNRGAAQSTNP